MPFPNPVIVPFFTVTPLWRSIETPILNPEDGPVIVWPFKSRVILSASTMNPVPANVISEVRVKSSVSVIGGYSLTDSQIIMS